MVLIPRDGDADAASSSPVHTDATTDHAAPVTGSQQSLAELLLLGALRETTRADAANAARVTAEHAHAALGRLLAEIVHELRTPLQAVGGYADLIAMGVHGPVTDQQRAALARIHAGVVHLVDLTTRLLEHAKIEAGHVEYEMAIVRVDSTMEAAASLVAPQADARRVTLTVDPCEGQVTVQADPGKLRQVLVNLLANAVKFTDAGGAVTMSARATAVSPMGVPSVAISVTDTGCGISSDDISQVFEPFVQVGPRSDAHEAGVGLGLAISRDLMRGMAGEITVESTLGVGTTVTVTLPQPA